MSCDLLSNTRDDARVVGFRPVEGVDPAAAELTAPERPVFSEEVLVLGSSSSLQRNTKMVNIGEFVDSFDVATLVSTGLIGRVSTSKYSSIESSG